MNITSQRKDSAVLRKRTTFAPKEPAIVIWRAGISPAVAKQYEITTMDRK